MKYGPFLKIVKKHQEETMFIIIVVLSTFILLIYNYVYHKKYRRLNLIPGPSDFPIIGNALQLYVSAEELWKFFCKLSDEYWPIFKLRVFFTNVIFIRHPDDLETILNSTKHIEKSFVYDMSHPWINTGLATSTGDRCGRECR